MRSEGGWAPAPDGGGAIENVAPLGPRATEGDGAVVAAGAICSLRSIDTSPSQISVSVAEYLEFESGKRVVVRNDRGVTTSRIIPPPGTPEFTAEGIHRIVLGALLPDEGEGEEPGELRSWKELSRLAADQNVSISPELLCALPLRWIFTPGVEALTCASGQ